MGKKEVAVPVGFEHRKMAASRGVQKIVVGVEDLGRRVQGRLEREDREGFRA